MGIRREAETKGRVRVAVTSVSLAAGFIPAATLSSRPAKRRYEWLLKKVPTIYRKESRPVGGADRPMRGNHLGSLSYQLRVPVEYLA